MEKTKENPDTQIAWQHKDIISKIFGERLKGNSLSVYGIKNPRIKDVKPTNLPAIEANELRLDNLFLMEDGAYAIVDYESSYSEKNKLKYLGYIARVSQRLYTEYGCYKRLRLIIIYTADVLPGTTTPVLDMGAFKMQIEEAFLTGMDSQKIKKELTGKIDRGEPFTEEDVMKLVIYPLTYKGDSAKQNATSEAIDIAEKITDKEKQNTALLGIFVFTDKMMRNEDAMRVIRRISMTKVGAIVAETYGEQIDLIFEIDSLKEQLSIDEREKNELRRENDSIKQQNNSIKQQNAQLLEFLASKGFDPSEIDCI